MGKLLIVGSVLSLLLSFYSCNSSSHLIYKYKNERVKVSFFESTKPDPRINRYDFYAKVDSSKTLIYFIFNPNNVFKIYQGNQSIVYSLTDANQPSVLLTELDKFVLNLAGIFIDSLGKKYLQFKKDATGFFEEVNKH